MTMDKGAHFYRCDFQVHTPRDANWVGSRLASPEDRRDFADRLVATCRSKGIGAIAITDHHDFAYVPFVKDAAALNARRMGSPSNRNSVSSCSRVSSSRSPSRARHS